MRKMLVFLLLVTGTGAAIAQNGSGFTFKGNYMGMTLEAFKAMTRDALKAENYDYTVWITTGQPNWRGKYKKEQEHKVPLPFCTDELHGFQGDDGTQKPGEVICNPAPGEVNEEARTVAGLTVTSVIYHFYQDRLFEIDIRFPAARFFSIKAAFQDKYGPPTEHSASDYQNGFGARWTGENLLWKHGTQTIFLDEGPKNGPGQNSFDELGSSSVRFEDKDWAPVPPRSAKPDF